MLKAGYTNMVVRGKHDGQMVFKNISLGKILGMCEQAGWDHWIQAISEDAKVLLDESEPAAIALAQSLHACAEEVNIIHQAWREEVDLTEEEVRKLVALHLRRIDELTGTKTG